MEKNGIYGLKRQEREGMPLLKTIKLLVKNNLNLYRLYRWMRSLAERDRELEIIPKILASHIQKTGNENAIDIGANKGIYTRLLLRRCRLQVYCFEPQPKLCEYIARRLKLYKGLHIFNIGLSDPESILKLHIPLFSNGYLADGTATFQEIKEKHESITVPVKTLDSFNLTDIRFIKIDVEGFESNVLAGAKETIKNNKPIMLIEIAQRHLDRDCRELTVEEVILQATNMGYKCYYYLNKQLVPFIFNVQLINELQKDDFIGKDKNVYNFFFFPMEMQIPSV